MGVDVHVDMDVDKHDDVMSLDVDSHASHVIATGELNRTPMLPEPRQGRRKRTWQNLHFSPVKSTFWTHIRIKEWFEATMTRQKFYKCFERRSEIARIITYAPSEEDRRTAADLERCFNLLQ